LSIVPEFVGHVSFLAERGGWGYFELKEELDGGTPKDSGRDGAVADLQILHSLFSKRGAGFKAEGYSEKKRGRRLTQLRMRWKLMPMLNPKTAEKVK